jgi:serine/threonine-protein kinase
MGDVYVAHDAELGRVVAIKVLHDRYAADESARARFTREARAAAQLSGHPHIVTIYDVGEWRGHPFIVMEHLSGGTLAERATAGPLPTTQALRFLREAASALDEAHLRGIVHRDVKPGNLILDARGRVRVADFGIARVADGSDATMTAAGTVLGTAGYLAPEQARGEPATAASDVYALGVVAFELLTGGRPFARPNETAEALAHVHEPPPRASEAGPWLPRLVDPIFERVLAKDPAQRYPDARSFVDALTTALAERSTQQRTRPLAVVEAPTPGPRRPGRRSHLPAMLAGLAFLGAAGVAAAAILEARAGGPTVTLRASQLRPISAPRVTVTHTVAHSTPPAAAPATPTPPPPTPKPKPHAAPPDGHTLNDRAYALEQAGNYAGAIPLLVQAVKALRGRGPHDPYEAYANYNLGIALLQTGRCREAMEPLRRAGHLEGGGKVKHAVKEARRCH